MMARVRYILFELPKVNLDNLESLTHFYYYPVLKDIGRPISPSVVRFNNRTNTLRYDWGNSRRESSHGFASSFITFNIICIICFAITIGSILTFHLLAHYSNADDSTRRYHTKNFIYLNISRLLPNYTFEV